MVTRKRLQHYNRHYCTACMTGTFGCRWHRYQQSKEKTHPRDFVWLGVSISTFLFVVFWFYFWLIANNSHSNINWFLFKNVGSWFDWHYLFVCLSSVAFTYVVLLMILVLLHVACGQELYMHWIHKVLVISCIIGCIASCIFIGEFWVEGYSLFELSLQVSGPFLHIGAVTIMTFLTWFIVEHWLLMTNRGASVFWLIFYIVLMLGLYISPLFIKSPCIMDGTLPAPPQMLAHRGASAILPENTLLAFEKAVTFSNVYGVETDVSISWDGVPFLLHDTTLKRTTNVEEVFPDRAGQNASRFNMSELQQLDAGSWFLHQDPHRTVGKLSETEKAACRNQTIPTLKDALEIAHKNDLYFMFDLKIYDEDEFEGHPYGTTFVEKVEEAIIQSKIAPDKILWLYGDSLNYTLNFTRVAPVKSSLPSVPELQARDTAWVNTRYDRLSWARLREYEQNNITTSVFVVDSGWLYSLLWCAGVYSMTSNNAQYFTDWNGPAWYMSSSLYLTMWLVTDFLSLIIVVAFFIIQRIRKDGKDFHRETASLQAAKSRMSQLRQRSNMKEKLLRTAEGIHESEPGIVGTHMTSESSLNQEMFDFSGSGTGSVGEVGLSSDTGLSYGGVATTERKLPVVSD